MAYLEQDALGKDPEFVSRVRVAMLRAAVAIQAEDPSALQAPAGFAGAPDALHAARSRLAHAAANDPEAHAGRFAALVAADPNTSGVNAGSSDGDIQFTVSLVWNTLAVGG